MTREQFQSLVGTYGSDWRRWPDAVRATGRAFIESDPTGAQAVLDDALWLDTLMDGAPRVVVSMDLRDRVVADGTHITGRRGLGLMNPLVGHLKFLLGAGWAVAACAGVVAGVLLSSQLTANMQADTVLYQASLDGADDLEILG